MHVCFCCFWFSLSVLSQEIGWEERLRDDLFYVGWDIKTLTQSINQLYLGVAAEYYFIGMEICLLDDEPLFPLTEQIFVLLV